MTLTTEQLNQIKADIAARKAMPEYGESVEGNIERLRVIGATRGHFSTETVEMLVRALEEKSRALADAERERDDWVEHSRKMEYRAIEAKEKLANREAQPVLYASEETLAYAKEGEKSLVTWSEPMGDAVIPLFTIPKAQTSGVVNLPTEFISDEGVLVRLEQVMAALALVGVKYERRGDACRAAMLNHVGDANEKAAEKCECSSIDYCENCLRAMLAQPVSGGYTFVPVEPTDEQLRLMLAVQWPALYREYLRHPLNGPKSREENERQIAIAKRQYAAMLAAAPEGGK